jgi:hypothetical protein
MSTRSLSTIALLLVLAISVGIYVVLEPSGETLEEGASGIAEATPSVGEVGAAVASDVQLEGEPGDENRSELTPPQAELASAGHRVRVLDLDGDPIAGVQVRAKFPQGEYALDEIEQWADYPDRFYSWRPEADDPRTDLQGLVTLPSREAGAAAVVLRGKAGYVILDEKSDDAVKPIDLQLHELAMVEVRVVFADGKPAAKRLISPWLADLDEPLTPEGEPNFTSLLPTHAFSDENGIAWLPLVLPPQLREVAELELDSLLLRAETREHLGNKVGHNFAFTDHTPIVLRLPPSGEMLLQLDGYPRGVIPSIRMVNPERAGGSPLSVLTGKMDGESHRFRFSTLPFGQQFAVRINMPKGSGGFGSRTSSSPGLPGGEVAGPTEAEPLAERVLTMTGATGLFGRFVLSEDAPFTIEQLRVAYAEAKGFTDDEQRAYHELRLAVFESGEFFARLINRPGQAKTLDALREIQFSFLPSKDVEGDQIGAVLRRPVSARIPLAISEGTEQADLGTITLVPPQPLLVVRVYDHQGEPLPGARAKLSGQTAQSRADNPARWLRGYPLDDNMYTDLNGELWVHDRDWPSELDISPLNLAGLGEIDRLQVELFAPGYLSLTAEVSASQGVVEMSMQAAGSLAGSVLQFEALHSVRLQALRPGTELDPNSHALVARVFAWANPNTARSASDFIIDSILAGTWDLSLSLASGELGEVLRITNVQVIAGEVCRDPRLQAIDLSSSFALLRIQLHDEGGTVLSTERDSSFRPTMAISRAGGELGYGEDARMRGGWIEYPVPPHGPFDLRIVALGFTPLNQTNVVAGDHQWTISRAAKRAFILKGIDELPVDAEWSLSVQWIASGTGQRQTLRSSDGPTFEFSVHGEGAYVCEWTSPALPPAIRGRVRQILNVSQAMIDGDQAIELTVPKAVLDAFRSP